jgi:hypothetical protein
LLKLPNYQTFNLEEFGIGIAIVRWICRYLWKNIEIYTILGSDILT